jgi:hypothetical protein
MSMNAALKIDSLSVSSQEYANAMENQVSGKRETTAALRRALARSCGIANGDVSAIRKDDVTDAVISDWLEQIVLGAASLTCDASHRDVFQSSVRQAIPAILRKVGRTGSLSTCYQLPKGKGQAPKFPPQFSVKAGGDNDPNWSIGLHWTEKENDVDEFGDRESYEPAHEPEIEHGSLAEKMASEAQPERDADFAVGMARNLLGEFLKETESNRDMIVQAQAVSELIAETAEIAAANLHMVSDSDLIAELKARGFRVSRVKAK